MTNIPADSDIWVRRIDDQRYWPLETIVRWSVAHVSDDLGNEFVGHRRHPTLSAQEALFRRRWGAILTHIANGAAPQPTIEGEWVTVYADTSGHHTAQQERKLNYSLVEVYRWSRGALVLPWDWPPELMRLMGDAPVAGAVPPADLAALKPVAVPVPPEQHTQRRDHIERYGVRGKELEGTPYITTEQALCLAEGICARDPEGFQRTPEQLRSLLRRKDNGWRTNITQFGGDRCPVTKGERAPGKGGHPPTLHCPVMLVVGLTLCDPGYKGNYGPVLARRRDILQGRLNVLSTSTNPKVASRSDDFTQLVATYIQPHAVLVGHLLANPQFRLS